MSTPKLQVLGKLKGEAGANGVGISKIEKTTTNGKVDTYTITLTNGDTYSFTVTNGNDGADGNDYILTEADKTEIAQMVFDKLPTYDGDVMEIYNGEVEEYVS